MTRALKGGYEWNHVRNYPRNLACFCGSGKKFKHCHRDLIPNQVIEGDYTGAMTGRVHWLDRLTQFVGRIFARGAEA